MKVGGEGGRGRKEREKRGGRGEEKEKDVERDRRFTCRREERNVGGRGGVMGENNLEFWRNLYNSCTCIYIGVLHLINVAHTHTHTHTHTQAC